MAGAELRPPSCVFALEGGLYENNGQERTPRKRVRKG